LPEVVHFSSGGLSCAADLYRGTGPALVVGRGFGGVREGNRREAEHLHAHGFTVLSIDYRWFGESEGEPRGRLHPLEQVEDFRNALSYLGVPSAGLWGTSFAGGVVLYAAAHDPRVHAVVAHMPIVHGERWLRSLRTPAQWEALLAAIEEERGRLLAGEAPRRIDLHGSAARGDFAVMPGDDEQAEHFANLRRLQPTWRDDITLESLDRVLDFRPLDVVAEIAPRAVCMLAAAGPDPVHPLDQILEAYDRLREPKRLHLMPEKGLDLRFDPAWSRCMDHAVDWFKVHLG